MKTSRVKRIYWGLLLIAIAVFATLKCVGVDIGFVGILSVTDIILAAIVVSITIGSIIRRNFWALPFELAIIFMLFENEIAAATSAPSENIINNWLLLGCALLISIGLSLIFPDTFKKKHLICSKSGSDTKFAAETKFGSETKYIDCTDFEVYNYNVKMGDAAIYFENTENYKGNGVLNVTCKMGNLTIHVPSAWHLVTNIESNMGAVDVEGTGDSNGPELVINGVSKMGDITVKLC